MLPAQERFYRVLENIDILPNDTVLYCNVTGQPYEDSDNLRELLVRQIAEPVLWNSILQNIFELSTNNPTSIWEVGAGKQLKIMMGKFNRNLMKSVDNISM